VGPAKSTGYRPGKQRESQPADQAQQHNQKVRQDIPVIKSNMIEQHEQCGEELKQVYPPFCRKVPFSAKKSVGTGVII
jgi:hypothetical protein